MQRDLSTLLADLTTRARPAPTSKNTVFVLIQLITEMLTMDASSATTDPAGHAYGLDGHMTLLTPPFYAAPSGNDGYAGLCQAS